MPRMQPLHAPYGEALQESFDAVLPPGVEPLVLFRTVATSERAWRKFRGGSLLDHGPLSLREREIVIDRTCARAGCEYEWGVHVALLAARAGFDAAQIEALANGPAEASCWTAAESALLATADALNDCATLNEAEWRRLKAHFDDVQALEVMMLCGFYRMVAYVANGLDLAPEPMAVGFPGRTATA